MGVGFACELSSDCSQHQHQRQPIELEGRTKLDGVLQQGLVPESALLTPLSVERLQGHACGTAGVSD